MRSWVAWQIGGEGGNGEDVGGCAGAQNQVHSSDKVQDILFLNIPFPAWISSLTHPTQLKLPHTPAYIIGRQARMHALTSSLAPHTRP